MNKTTAGQTVTALPPILVIDDDPAVLSTLRDLGQSMNSLRLVLHLDPSTAAEAAADPTIGLIVCDYRFPRASGVTFIEDLRKRGIQTPVLFISGSPDSSAVIRASQIEHTSFLGKPFSFARFRDAIASLLGEGNGGRARPLTNAL